MWRETLIVCRCDGYLAHPFLKTEERTTCRNWTRR